MVEFTSEEKEYLKKVIIPGLEDVFNMATLDESEDTLLFNITGKLREMCKQNGEKSNVA